MRYRAVGIILAIVVISGCIARVERKPESFDEKRVITACEYMIAGFQSELKQELVAALSEGGPAAALRVCAVKAPAIADRYSQLPGIDIRRVSLRQRNPYVFPDRFEDSVLQKFAMARTDEPQTSAALMRDSTVITRFRYMKEIKVGQLCLSCHGAPAGFSEDLKKALAEKYPTDRAVGYGLGDSRGAYSIVVTYPIAKETITKLLSDNGR